MRELILFYFLVARVFGSAHACIVIISSLHRGFSKDRIQTRVMVLRIRSEQEQPLEGLVWNASDKRGKKIWVFPLMKEGKGNHHLYPGSSGNVQMILLHSHPCALWICSDTHG